MASRISFIGRGQNENRIDMLAYCTIGNDLFRFDLQAPLFMRDEAYGGLEELIKAMHSTSENNKIK